MRDALGRPQLRYEAEGRDRTGIGQQRVKTEALRVSWLGLKLSTFTTFYEQV